MENYNEAVTLITGAASGIGRELARQLAREGAILFLADVNKAELDKVVDAIHRQGIFAEGIELDVTDAAAFEKAVDYVVSRYGRIEYIFNNAGISVTGEMQDLGLHHWKKVMDVNLMGVVHGSMYAYKHMLKQRWGHIVNIASLAGFVAMPLGLPYTTSKHAVVGFCRTLREEGKAHRIKVTCICPGFIDSNIYEANEGVNMGDITFRSLVPFRMVSTESAVTTILKGVSRNKAVVIFPFYARLLRFLQQFAPFLLKGLYQKSLNQYRAKRKG